MPKVPVSLSKTPDLSYDILIEPGLIDTAAALLEEKFQGRAVALISDSNVAEIYGGKLLTGLRTRDFRLVELIEFAPGEASKCRQVKERLEDRLFEAGFARDSLVVALGGGVTGDLAGYVAATFNRGVPMVQIPTSLLAMADSSIGGKVGIDVPWGKNLLGAFHQPSLVLIDPSVLVSLPQRELCAGMAEVVKHGVIRDAGLFTFIDDNLDNILACDQELMAELVARNCRIKAEVVSLDERESNLRQILNFGHTLGHAVESFSGFGWLHGEAVAAGMVAEAELAAGMGLMDPEVPGRIAQLLNLLNLPVELSALDASADMLVELTRLDKKARSGRARYALASGIGAMATDESGGYGIEADEAEARRVLVKLGARS
jgi:3-dehydroquinate synthase